MDSTPLSIRTDPIRTVRVASAIAPNYNLLGNNPKSVCIFLFLFIFLSLQFRFWLLRSIPISWWHVSSIFISVQDCGRDDPELRNETKKRFVDLLTEELLLQKVVAEDNKRHANFTLGQAKRVAFHFLKETEKCNAAMETCEARREEAEMSLRQVRKETAMWELRARKFGWSA